MKKYREEKRERFLGADEYASLGRTLAEVETDGSEPPAVVAAIRLLMLTGCRLGEIMTLKWSYGRIAVLLHPGRIHQQPVRERPLQQV